ncbi:hypothetical protein GCM10028796_32720 [Ramlibacter monticola]|uniref:DUF1643 domain-containing protein n=1 Tax=Ramlibacter monticola TaxID=1926872 RepID=A0A937CV05_9BURK|nr:DUF1643 domain-containing protein [Ramlibacter monticola]
MSNIFAWRDTDPRAMKAAPEPVGPENDQWLRQLADEAGIVVAAWGNHGRHRGRGEQVRKLLAKPQNCANFETPPKPGAPREGLPRFRLCRY